MTSWKKVDCLIEQVMPVKVERPPHVDQLINSIDKKKEELQQSDAQREEEGN